MTPKHLTYQDLHRQMWNCQIGIVDIGLLQPPLKKVVIRTATGDHYLCAVHREGELLVLDMGQQVEEA